MSREDLSPVLALSGFASLDVSLNSCTAGCWMRPKQRLPPVRPIQELLKGGYIPEYKGDIHGRYSGGHLDFRL